MFRSKEDAKKNKFFRLRNFDNNLWFSLTFFSISKVFEFPQLLKMPYQKLDKIHFQSLKPLSRVL